MFASRSESERAVSQFHHLFSIDFGVYLSENAYACELCLSLSRSPKIKTTNTYIDIYETYIWSRWSYDDDGRRRWLRLQIGCSFCRRHQETRDLCHLYAHRSAASRSLARKRSSRPVTWMGTRDLFFGWCDLTHVVWTNGWIYILDVDIGTLYSFVRSAYEKLWFALILSCLKK